MIFIVQGFWTIVVIFIVIFTRPLKMKLEEHWKAVVWGEIEKSGMVDHI